MQNISASAHKIRTMFLWLRKLDNAQKEAVILQTAEMTYMRKVEGKTKKGQD